MTTMEILMACIGFLICASVVALVGLVIAGIFWHLFVASMNSDIDNEVTEE
jgi:hypothetical protein